MVLPDATPILIGRDRTRLPPKIALINSVIVDMERVFVVTLGQSVGSTTRREVPITAVTIPRTVPTVPIPPEVIGEEGPILAPMGPAVPGAVRIPRYRQGQVQVTVPILRQSSEHTIRPTAVREVAGTATESGSVSPDREGSL